MMSSEEDTKCFKKLLKLDLFVYYLQILREAEVL